MDFWVQMLYVPHTNTEIPKIGDIVHVLVTDSMGSMIQRHDKLRVVDNRIFSESVPMLVTTDVITGEISRENMRVLAKLEGYPRHWFRVT